MDCWMAGILSNVDLAVGGPNKLPVFGSTLLVGLVKQLFIGWSQILVNKDSVVTGSSDVASSFVLQILSCCIKSVANGSPYKFHNDGCWLMLITAWTWSTR